MNGIVTIAFGKEYDKIAAHTMRHSRNFTDLPIFVLTNLVPEERHLLWQEIEDVQFILVPNVKDRVAKMMMYVITANLLEKAIYIDADALVQKQGLESIFDMLDHADFVLNGLHYWRKGEKVPKVYAKAMRVCGSTLPIECYNGGFMAWRPSATVEMVFKMWYDFWELTGKGRDMPALSCAIQQVKPLIFDVGLSPVFAPAGKDPNAIVQHNYNDTFFKDFNLPTYQENKSFDSDPTDFKFVDFVEDEEDA
jgi:hypothetical protein